MLKRYWILVYKRAIRSVISKCLKALENVFPRLANPLALITQDRYTDINMSNPLTLSLKKMRLVKTHKTYFRILFVGLKSVDSTCLRLILRSLFSHPTTKREYISINSY